MSFIEGPHPLLEAQSPAYTNATVRRAFIVWMHCGQKNSFKDVCNYYHHLEMLEEKLPADRRASSRHHEFNMFSNPPPTSPYLNQLFPKLYSQSSAIQHYIKKAEAKSDSIFKLDSFTDINIQTGVTTNDIVNTSHMIKKYCKSHMIPLKRFLAEFKEYARKCGLNYTVHNVAFYIKRKMVEEELLMVENYSKSLNFLNLTVENSEGLGSLSLNTQILESKYVKTNEDLLKNSPKKVTILTRDNKSDILSQYWNDLTSNYEKIARNTATRT